MESGASQPDAPVEGSIAELVNEYFDRRQAGEDLTPERFAAEHPALAQQLAPYLEGLALIDRARSTAQGERVAPGVGRDDLPAIAGYELYSEIGRGGMGVVYEALQVSTKRIVAVKVMLAAPFASESARRRFAREVELAARLDHPGIVRVLESGSVAGQPYYAMDYVRGTRLDRYLADACLDVPSVLKLFALICEAVDGAHRHGVIHRDLKAANVLVDEEGRPHVLDFGLAKAIDQTDAGQTSFGTLSSPGQVLGTLGYLSPEQAAGRTAEIDARTDVYALGVMLFEALTGRLPIDMSGRPSEVIQRILETPPTPPTKLSRRVNAELETIVLKSLAKEPAHRYASARELAEDIGRYLSGEAILARRPSSLYRVRKKLVKHRMRIGLVAAAAGVALVVLWTSAWWSQHQRAERAARELATARQAALRAQQLLDIGDAKVAAAMAEVVVAQYPEVPDGWLVQSQARFRTRAVEQALVNLERQSANMLAPWAAQALLSEILRNVGDSERADKVAADARRGMPDSADGWYLRSLATLSVTDAASYAERAVQHDPTHILGWARLAYLDVCLGRPDAALQAADRLIALEPRTAGWRTLKGDVLVRQHEFKRAVEVYTDVIRNFPGSEAPYTNRAVAYRRMKCYGEAIAEYDRILAPRASHPGTVPVWYRYQRATPLWMSGRAEEAATDYRHVRAITGRPHYADARLVVILHELNRTDEADAVLQAALRDTDDPWLAKVFACLAGRVSAAELAQAAEADKPEHQCEACYYAGEACLLRGEQVEARTWFERCVQTGLEFDPRNIFLAIMNEYELAEWRLESLSATTTQPDRG